MSIDLLETSAASSGVLPISSNVAASAVLPAQPWTFRPGHHALQRALLNSVPMVAADAAVVSLSLAAGLSVVHVLGVAGGGDLTALLLPLCGALVMSFWLLGLYPGIGLNPVVELRQTSCGSTVVFGVFLAAMQINHAFFAPVQWGLLIAWPLTLVSIPLARAATRQVCSRSAWWGDRVIVFGRGQAGSAVIAHLQSRPGLGLRPVGVVDVSGDDSVLSSHPSQMSSADVALRIAEREGATWAILAMPERCRDEVLQVIDRHAAAFPHILVMSDMEGLPSLWTSAHECGGMPGLRITDRLLMPVPRAVKRSLDLGAILLASPLVLPLLAVLAISAKLSSPGPICFGHQRIGLRGRRFKAWKFRSMVTNGDQVLQNHLANHPESRLEWERTQKLRNDPRVTWFGRILRKTSLDELPQLWNVLRGEMSLVGPRPIVDAEVSKYTHRFELYTKVVPGITGLWQVSGRNDTTYDQRVEFDAFYARNWSPWLDLFILARTVKVVLFRDGAY